MVARAADLGVLLMVENIDPEDCKRLIESFHSDTLQISVDTGHAHYAHGSTGAPPVDFYLRSAGEQLGHVHLQDADCYADRHWAIGQDTIRWHEVFRALATLETRPRLILELRDTAGILPSVEWLAARGLAQ